MCHLALIFSRQNFVNLHAVSLRRAVQYACDSRPLFSSLSIENLFGLRKRVEITKIPCVSFSYADELDTLSQAIIRMTSALVNDYWLWLRTSTMLAELSLGN